MKKMSKPEFLFILSFAVSQARLNRDSILLRGWQIRDTIDRAKLPSPDWKVLEEADQELRESRDPIFRAVDELSESGAGRNLGIVYQMALAEAAWGHYLGQMPRGAPPNVPVRAL